MRNLMWCQIRAACSELSGTDTLFAVTCIIMQKNGAGLHTASSCFWDNSTDGKLGPRIPQESLSESEHLGTQHVLLASRISKLARPDGSRSEARVPVAFKSLLGTCGTSSSDPKGFRSLYEWPRWCAIFENCLWELNEHWNCERVIRLQGG